MNEKKELYQQFINKIDGVNDPEKLKKIAIKVGHLNDLLDIHDSGLKNFIDEISKFFSPSIKGKIKKDVKDCFDKFDEYDSKETGQIVSTLKEINDICEDDFWTRLGNIFKGS
ncbi:MAG: hypothetical protein LKM30_05270 [Bacilli bacterium]|nr:hypothetical protein [Bacilli bacterium]